MPLNWRSLNLHDLLALIDFSESLEVYSSSSSLVDLNSYEHEI